MLLCFAFAYGLNALGIWLWAAFLIVAGACVLIIGGAALIAWRLVRHVTGMRKTRTSLADDVSFLRRRKPATAARTSAKAG
jgi:uncharacterized membrane protein YqjE